MGLYDRYILPALLDCACSSKPIQYQRRKIAPKASGVVLEMGFGSGPNLALYDPAKVTAVYALEPSQGMLSRARKAAAASPLPIQILHERAEDLSIGPSCVDTVVITYALCTIPDPIAALRGARRALKPDGRLLFCEHGLAPDETVRRTQHRLSPLWSRIAGGCRLNRDIQSLVRAGGFQIEQVETMYLPKTPRFAGFNIWGTARPA
jgi:ubiquinone/menaquinone biosynthesis C-methylase UbiE